MCRTIDGDAFSRQLACCTSPLAEVDGVTASISIYTYIIGMHIVHRFIHLIHAKHTVYMNHNQLAVYIYLDSSINQHIYIYKEELKTVVRELLACTQPNRHDTSTALWTPYRRVSLRGRRAQIRFSRGARGEKPENDRPPFWFYGESIRTSVHGSHNVIVEAPS